VQLHLERGLARRHKPRPGVEFMDQFWTEFHFYTIE
jgi:hypothetical protein